MNQIDIMKGLRFGTEIEFTGTSRDAVIRAIQAVTLGTTRYVGGPHGAWEIVMLDGRAWQVMEDGSVTGSRTGNGGEVVSPILTWTDMDLLQRIVRAVRAAGAVIDSTCGQHVHVDGAAFKANPGKVRDLLAFAVRWQAPTLACIAPIEERREWCRQIDRDIVERYSARTIRTLSDARRAWYGTSDRGTGYVNHYDRTRYNWLNVHALFDKGTIEFRAFNGTLHAGKVKANVILALAFIARVLSKNIAFSKADKVRLPTRANAKALTARLQLAGDEFTNARNHILGVFGAPVEGEVA